MESTFSCEEDGQQFAVYCCACTFPLPCFCHSCSSGHFSKPGFHCLLPVTARNEITSERDLSRLRYRLNQLEITHAEMQKVTKDFQTAKTDVEATFMEIQHLLTVAKDTHLAELSKLQAQYENSLEFAIQYCYSHAWDKDFTSADSLAELIWSYVPDQEAPFSLYFTAKCATQLIAQLYQVQWTFSWPGLPSHPEDAFPLTIKEDFQGKYTLIAQPGQLVAELKRTALLRNSISQEEAYFYNETGQLREDWTVEQCKLDRNSLVHLSAQVTLTILAPNWDSGSYTVPRSLTIGELLDRVREPQEPELSSTKQLLYETQWLDPACTLAHYSVPNKALLWAIRRITVPFDVSIDCVAAGKRLNCQVQGSDTTIDQVKERIEAVERLLPALYDLTLFGQVLKEQLSLAHYSIVPSSTLQLQPKELGLIELEVRLGQGKVTVQAERWGTVAAVKEKCKCTNEVLALEGHELDDARILQPSLRLHPPPPSFTDSNLHQAFGGADIPSHSVSFRYYRQDEGEN